MHVELRIGQRLEQLVHASRVVEMVMGGEYAGDVELAFAELLQQLGRVVAGVDD